MYRCRVSLLLVGLMPGRGALPTAPTGMKHDKRQRETAHEHRRECQGKRGGCIFCLVQLWVCLGRPHLRVLLPDFGTQIIPKPKFRFRWQLALPAQGPPVACFTFKFTIGVLPYLYRGGPAGPYSGPCALSQGQQPRIQGPRSPGHHGKVFFGNAPPLNCNWGQ